MQTVAFTVGLAINKYIHTVLVSVFVPIVTCKLLVELNYTSTRVHVNNYENRVVENAGGISTLSNKASVKRVAAPGASIIPWR